MSNPDSCLVSIQGLNKSFAEGEGERIVLKDVQMEVRKGDFIAIGGPSGSGKSTLLNMLGGIDIPDSGSITIDGSRINTLSESGRTLFRRHHIGIVFQFFNLVPTLTVRENLLLPLALCGQDETEGQVSDWLERLDLLDRAGD